MTAITSSEKRPTRAIRWALTIFAAGGKVRVFKIAGPSYRIGGDNASPARI